MEKIPDGSIDMILCDLPYAMTEFKWDSIIPFDKLWGHYNRIIKDCGVIALTGSQPFTSVLGASQIKKLKYSLVWEKEKGTNFLNVKKQPFKAHEDILIFYDSKSTASGKASKLAPIRQYLQSEKVKTGLTAKEIDNLLGNQRAMHYFTNGIQFTLPSVMDYKKLQSTGCFKKSLEELKSERQELLGELKPTYNPQMTVGTPYKKRNGAQRDGKWNFKSLRPDYDAAKNDGTRYPRSVLKFNTEKGLHPTQKPVALFEWLVKTYSNEGETVLDNCMGSGTTAIACINTARNYIGFETNVDYYNMANERICEWKQKKRVKKNAKSF